ncbi:hypothetical protein BKA70DRAFT_1227305 [Coprinopsis sp. MPI-PUGE-AT-0042]|nr:hypothetical protein BKA70DRAFT_1227305 [Coprinopsis sp. MPI-PUGE-AT-0042]
MPVGQFGSPPTGSGPQKTNENAPLSPVPGGYAFIDAALASGAYPAPMEEEGYSPLPWPSAGMTQSSNGNSQWRTGCSVSNVSEHQPLSWGARNHGQLAAFELLGYPGTSGSYHHHDTLNVLEYTGPDIGPLASSLSACIDPRQLFATPLLSDNTSGYSYTRSICMRQSTPESPFCIPRNRQAFSTNSSLLNFTTDEEDVRRAKLVEVALYEASEEQYTSPQFYVEDSQKQW